MPVDKDIAEYLEDLGYGTVGNDIYVGFLPDDPDSAICVVQTSGEPPEPTIGYEHVGFQVRVRNISSSTCWTNINAILKALHALTHATIETRLYDRIDATGSPSFMGRDEKDRNEFSVNFIAFKAME